MKSASSSRLRRNLGIFVGLVALYTVAGFFVVPLVLKSQLEKRATAALGRTVTVEKVRFNPYTLSLTLENFDMRVQAGAGSFVGWTRLYVNFEALASLAGDWVFERIELEGFHSAVNILADGSPNFTDIIDKLKSAPAEKEPGQNDQPARPIRIDSLQVVQAQVKFSDASRAQPFATVVGPLSFTITGFRTVSEKGAPYRFEAVTEAGERLMWLGTLTAQPFHSRGELTLENIVLAKYAPYYAGQMQADITAGNISVRGHYEIDWSEGNRVLKLLDGALRVRGLTIVERADQATAVELPELEITGVDADALARKVTVDAVMMSGGHLRVRREQDGTLNLATMFSPPASELVASTPTAPPGPVSSATSSALVPEIAIAEINLKDFQVDVSDLAAPRAAQLGLKGIQLTVKNVSLTEGAVMPLQLALDWAPQGRLNLDGTVSIKPELKAELKTTVEGLGILPLSPYLEEFINARLTQGAVTATLDVQLAAGAAKTSGEIKLENFGLVDGAHNDELAGVKSLELKGLSVSTAPRFTVTLTEVNLVGPYARIVVNADKSLNLAAIARTAAVPEGAAVVTAAPAPNVPASAAASAGPKIEVGRIVVSEGDFSFADRSLTPNVRMAINQFQGTITGLSSENFVKAGVELKAMVDGAGPVAITGQLDPLGTKKFVDLKVYFRNVDLLPLSPYSGKFAGYELARGKLLLDVKFLLDDKKIEASNVVTLNQFTFGAAVPSPEATGLPVRLGVALLKDREGKIVIDVPIQGSTDDPSFRIGRVVGRVIANLLTKAAVSPFALLGSMFGGGGDELAYQDFAAGAAELQTAEIGKLETMTKALTNRPGLSVSLEGSFDGPADTFALKQEKFAAELRRAIWEQKHVTQPDIAPPEKLEISAEEDAAMVKRLFDEKFPPGTEFGAPPATAPVAVAPPDSTVKKGILSRVVDVVTLKNVRAHQSAPEKKSEEVPTEPSGSMDSMGPSREEMAGRLAEATDVTDEDLRALASARAQQVRDYFINVGKIDPERLFLASTKADPAQTGKGSRVFLSLQ